MKVRELRELLNKLYEDDEKEVLLETQVNNSKAKASFSLDRATIRNNFFILISDD